VTTVSYPAVGKNGFTETAWAKYFGSRDGVVEGFTTSLNLTLLDAGSICRVAAGSVMVNGFRLDVTSDHDLVCPTTAGTYYIGVLYDPALNVADASGNASPDGPCQLILTSTVDTTGGKTFVLLYSFTRSTGQALSAVAVADQRHWLGSATIDWTLAQGDPPVGDYLMPRGTVRLATDKRAIYLRTLNTAGNLVWLDLLNDGPFPFPSPSSLVSRDSSPSAVQYFRYAGCMVKLRGSLKRSSGANLSTGSDVTLGTMPVGWRPAFTERFICKTSSAGGQVEVKVENTGAVVMTDNNDSFTWVNLSPVSYRAEN
jgi:hypothetical protein